MSTIRDRNAAEAAERIRAKKLELETRCEQNPEQLRESMGEFASFTLDVCVSAIVRSTIEEAIHDIMRPTA